MKAKLYTLTKYQLLFKVRFILAQKSNNSKGSIPTYNDKKRNMYIQFQQIKYIKYTYSCIKIVIIYKIIVWILSVLI